MINMILMISLFFFVSQDNYCPLEIRDLTVSILNRSLIKPIPNKLEAGNDETHMRVTVKVANKNFRPIKKVHWELFYLRDGKIEKEQVVNTFRIDRIYGVTLEGYSKYKPDFKYRNVKVGIRFVKVEFQDGKTWEAEDKDIESQINYRIYQL